VLRRVTMSHIDQSASQKGQSKAVPKFVPTAVFDIVTLVTFLFHLLFILPVATILKLYGQEIWFFL